MSIGALHTTGSHLIQPREATEAAGAAAGALSCLGCGAIGAFVVIAVPLVQIALLVWVARDARARGMDNAVVWMILALVLPILGIVLYLFSRPQGNLVACPHCGNKRLQAAAKCPHCGNA